MVSLSYGTLGHMPPRWFKWRWSVAKTKSHSGESLKRSKGLSCLGLGGSFRSPGFANQLSDRLKICREWLRAGLIYQIKISLRSHNPTGLQRYPTYKGLYIWFTCYFFDQTTAQTTERIFYAKYIKRSGLAQGSASEGSQNHGIKIGGVMPQNYPPE